MRKKKSFILAGLPLLKFHENVKNRPKSMRKYQIIKQKRLKLTYNLSKIRNYTSRGHNHIILSSWAKLEEAVKSSIFFPEKKLSKIKVSPNMVGRRRKIFRLEALKYYVRVPKF